MLFFLIFLHVIICIALIFIVLIQTGKGGLDSNFGGIASNALGTQGANEFIKKWTKIILVAFVLSCVLLATHVRGGDEQAGTSRRRSRLSEEAHREMQHVTPDAESIFDAQTEIPFEVQSEEVFEVIPDGVHIEYE